MGPELILIGVVILLVIIVFFYLIPFPLWISAMLSGVYVNLLQLMFMRFRKVPPGLIVTSLITATKAGLHLTRNDLEAHYLAGGRVVSVVNALISAQKAN